MNFNYFHFWKLLCAFLAFIKLETRNQLNARNMMKILLALLGCLLILQISIFAEVKVKGKAYIFNSNEGSARNQALKNALRNAVEQGVGVMLDAASITKNWKLIQDEIYTSAKGFISEYKITSEGKSQDSKYWEVFIEAEVSNELIKDRLTILRILHQKQSNKRFALIFSSKLENETQYSRNSIHSVITSIQNEFIISGFRLFKLDSLERKGDMLSNLQKITELGVDVLLEVQLSVGKIQMNRTTAFNAAQAYVTISAYDVDTRQQISSIQSHKKHFTNSKPLGESWKRALATAAEKAAKSASIESITNIIEYYKTTGDIGNSYFIVFKNYSKNEEDQLLNILENLEGFQLLKELKNNTGYISVEYFSRSGKSRLRRRLREKAEKEKIFLQSEIISGNRLQFVKPGTN